MSTENYLAALSQSKEMILGNQEQVNKKGIPTYKLITFDIDTIVAKEIAGKRYTQMYQNIRSHMEKFGFYHRQGSVYVSKKPLMHSDIIMLVYSLNKTYPYISKCIRDMTVTNISKVVFSLNEQLTYTGRADEYADFYKTHDLCSVDKSFQR